MEDRLLAWLLLLLVGTAGLKAQARQLLGTPRSILQYAVKSPSLTTFVAALDQTGLAVGFGDPNLVATVFAPTNSAFAKLAKDLNLNQTELLHSYILKPTLLYHVIPGVAASTNKLIQLKYLTTKTSRNLTATWIPQNSIKEASLASKGAIGAPGPAPGYTLKKGYAAAPDAALVAAAKAQYPGAPSYAPAPAPAPAAPVLALAPAIAPTGSLITIHGDDSYADILVPNVVAGKGVVHIIDEVLVPNADIFGAYEAA